MPDVPPLDEVGLKGYEAIIVVGHRRPGRNAGRLVAKLNDEINKALGSDEMKRFLEGEGAEAGAMSPKAFRDLIEAEVKRWDKVAKDANIRVDWLWPAGRENRAPCNRHMAALGLVSGRVLKTGD